MERIVFYSPAVVLTVVLSAAGAAAAQTPAGPTSLPQAPTEQAVVSLSGGKLMIQAKNSSLRSILDRLQLMTGVKIEGLGKDERIFGVYGPGDPQKVLAELLDSSDYNVIIAGRAADGAPREIVLSTPSALPPPSALAQRASNDNSYHDPESEGYTYTPTPESPAARPPQPRPGAEQPRTAQEMLQELQRMRQQAIPSNDSQQ